MYREIKRYLNEADEKKFRITWKYNINEHTGDAEDEGSFDIMAADEDDAERKAYRELDNKRISYDEFWVENVSDADVFGIEYKGQYYKQNGLKSGRDPEIDRLFVTGNEDEVKSFASKLVGHFIADTFQGEPHGAYKCLSIKEVYIASIPKRDTLPDVNDPDIFNKLQGSFVPLDLTSQKEIQDKILKAFKDRIKSDHYRAIEFQMDETKLDDPNYIGTICIDNWHITNGDIDELSAICKENNCTKAPRDYKFEAFGYLCFPITKNN